MSENLGTYLPVEIAVEPKSKADQEKMSVGLQRLAAEDPSFRVETDHESGQTIMKGMGELHLDILIDRLKREFKVEANIGQPQVAYREKLGRAAEIDYTHKKQSGGTGQFGRVKLQFEPLEAGSGFQFESAIVGGAVPKEYIPGVEKGLEMAKENGLLAGYPVTDFKATLVDGAFHDVDSSVLAFEIAARGAFRELKSQGDPRLMEPIMSVEVVTPEILADRVQAELTRRRATIGVTANAESKRHIHATAPLVPLLGLPAQLVHLTDGQGMVTMVCVGMAEVPRAGGDGDDTFPPASGMRISA
ncbi:MAG: hypothetical protein R3C00_01065 [Hyphomonas sp.]